MESRHWDEGAREGKNELGFYDSQALSMCYYCYSGYPLHLFPFDSNCSASKDVQKMRRTLSYWSVGLDSIVRSNLL